MNENRHEWDDAQLDALLREGRISPALPPRFQQNVWRRIENSEAPGKAGSWLDAVASLILRPRLAVTLATVLVLAGATAGALQGRQAARQQSQMNYVASVAPATVR